MSIINFTKADILRSQPLENEKWYSWSIRAVTGPTPSKDKQSYNHKVTFSLIDHSPDLDGKEVERTYNSKMTSMWIPLVTAVRGIPVDHLPKENFALDTDELIGKKIDGKYTLEPYEGQLIGKVEVYQPYKSMAGQAPAF